MFLPIQLTAESIDMVIFALRKLPHETVHDLVMDIATQRDQNKASAGVPMASNPPKKPRKQRKPRAPKAIPAAQTDTQTGDPFA